MIEDLYKLICYLVESIISLLKILIRSSFSLEKYSSVRDSIFILGNGPSLKQEIENHREKLSKQSLLCVNGFSLSEYFEELKPSYYIICSPGFYNLEAIDYNVEVRKNIIDNLVDKTSWPLRFFLPVGAKSNKIFIDQILGNKNIIISYYNTTPVEGPSPFKNKIFKLGLGSPRPHNVVIPSILCSINAGFKKIFLFGVDHSWLPQIKVNDNNEVLINQKHFYDENSSEAKQMHKNEGRGNRHLHEVLEKFCFSFKAYHELNNFAKTENCKIVNLTKDSFIDAFERGSISNHLQ